MKHFKQPSQIKLQKMRPISKGYTQHIQAYIYATNGKEKSTWKYAWPEISRRLSGNKLVHSIGIGQC